MNLILLGAPGAGKGTQAELLMEKLSIPGISTGNMLREAIKNGTELGKKVKSYMDGGLLVPDELIMGIVAERVAQPDCANGFILDGVPRTLAQAEALDAAGVRIDHVVSIEIEDSVIEGRMTGRRVCSACGGSFHIVANPPKTEGVCDLCGGELVIRKDDAPETVRKRLEVYHAQTEVLMDYYGKQGKIRHIEGNQSIEGASEDILKAIGAKA
ncbi:MAG: adenylate kinase [Oscillospiraceae bacterium]|nr:adenylate kinase [Oscillospiraceae bacterium]